MKQAVADRLKARIDKADADGCRFLDGRVGKARAAVGAVRVTEAIALSTSATVIVPLAVVLFVVSPGVPVVSGTPLGRPSSETLAEAFATVGASLTALTVRLTVAVEVPPWPSLMVYVKRAGPL